MSDNLPALVPSLARAFEPARQELRQALSAELSPPQIVVEARRALDEAGVIFTDQTDDSHIHKAGLWLIEMVKAGAGVLDYGTGAEVTWSEVARPQARKWAGRGLFYGAAALFAVVGYIEKSGLVVLSAGVLAGLRFFDPKDWGHVMAKLPFVKRAPTIEDQSGRRLLAQARIKADTQGFIDSLADALKTADHILLRLSEPTRQTHWRDDVRLMSLVHSLLEARKANDGDFALKLIGQELETVLASEDIEIISYSVKTKDMFDILPAMGEDGVKEVAPALKSGDSLLRRGTVWQGEK